MISFSPELHTTRYREYLSQLPHWLTCLAASCLLRPTSARSSECTRWLRSCSGKDNLKFVMAYFFCSFMTSTALEKLTKNHCRCSRARGQSAKSQFTPRAVSRLVCKMPLRMLISSNVMGRFLFDCAAVSKFENIRRQLRYLVVEPCRRARSR